MFDDLPEWSENWQWIADLLVIPDPPAFAEYNTAESLSRMDDDHLPWDDLIPEARHERWNGTIGKD
jgi:hypothetical protein